MAGNDDWRQLNKYQATDKKKSGLLDKCFCDCCPWYCAFSGYGWLILRAIGRFVPVPEDQSLANAPMQVVQDDGQQSRPALSARDVLDEVFAQKRGNARKDETILLTFFAGSLLSIFCVSAGVLV